MSSVVTQAPQFTLAEAQKAAEESFGITGVFKALPSERDQNFHIISKENKEYVFKIANKKEDLDTLIFQNKAMIHIHENKHLFSNGIGVCPEVMKCSSGEHIDTVSGPDGENHFVRMLTYLPGKPLGLVKPHDATLLKTLGQYFGQLDVVLSGFDHPAVHRKFHWDVKQAPNVIEKLVGNIGDKEKRGLVKHFLQQYQVCTQPYLEKVRQSVIHNDGNDYNILVTRTSRWVNHVDSVIDYGDMVFSHTINELAIVCAYVMMGKIDPLNAAARVVSGYHSVFPITEDELAILFDLILMRLCMSVCHAAHQFSLSPENEYLQISEKPAWSLLEQLKTIHPRFAEYIFRDACSLAPVPQSHAVSAWLQKNKDQFAPIVDPDPSKDSAIILDLSVESPLINTADLKGGITEISRAIFDNMHKEKVKIGVGRYDEARSIYFSDNYRQPSDELPEMRTIHLGIDLNMLPGTGVKAFYDGKIHSFANNASPFDYGPTIILEHETTDNLCFYSLWGHLSLSSLESIHVGQHVAKGEKFAEIGDMDVNGGWPPHLHFQVITDLLAENCNFKGVAPPSQRSVWKSLSPDPNSILCIPNLGDESPKRTKESILEHRRQHLGRNFSIAYRDPLKIVRGRGQYLNDSDGQAYLDAVNNVTHVGHCHPDVIAAGQVQMSILNTNTRYLHDHIISYTDKLLKKLPDRLTVCFFVCTGSEANELAFRLARAHTGEKDIITVDGAYHGNTNLLIDISPYKHDGPGGQGAPDFVQTVLMPDSYRGPYKGNSPETGRAYAEDVKKAIDRIASQGRRVGAFICESLLGCGGQMILPQDYLKTAFQYVRDAGGVCIADEVQVGFGRVGSHFWAFETQDVIPDIVTLGKPIGNGHPMAAVVTTTEIAESFNNGMEYFNTFGGNPVSCAIGMAVMDVVEKEALQKNALETGKRLLQGFQKLKAKYPLIGDVRGMGLYLGIELVKDKETLEPAAEEADYIINRLKEHGILISTDGPLHNVLKLKPPLVFSEKNADEVIAALDKILAEDYLQL